LEQLAATESEKFGPSDLPQDAARFWNAVVGSRSVRHLTKQGQLISMLCTLLSQEVQDVCSQAEPLAAHFAREGLAFPGSDGYSTTRIKSGNKPEPLFRQQ
jgi:hypothetical protein